MVTTRAETLPHTQRVCSRFDACLCLSSSTEQISWARRWLTHTLPIPLLSSLWPGHYTGEPRSFILLPLIGLEPGFDSLANQEVLRWQLAMLKELGDNVTLENIKEYLWKTLKSGQVVPGLVRMFSPSQVPSTNNG